MAPEKAKRVKHPAPFPVELAERIIKFYSYQCDLVLDPFGGSGTVSVAANNLSRHSVYIDNSKEYLEIAKKRII